MSSYAPQTPSPTKRSKSRSRISHLLRGGGSYSLDSTTTPSRQSTDANSNIPESPMLLNALKIAARRGASVDSIDELSEEGFSPIPMSPSDERPIMMINRSSSGGSSSEHSLASSYANSIEAMAASVEAAATNRQRPRKSPKKSPAKKSSNNKNGTGNTSSRQQPPHYEQLPYQTTKRQLFSSTNKKRRAVVVSKITIGHLVAIAILVPFIMMEAFLSVLVFTYYHNGIRMNNRGEGLLVANDDDDNNNSAAEIYLEEDHILVPPSTNEAGSGGVPYHHQAAIDNEIENDDQEVGDDLKSLSVAMQSMLKHALAQLNDASDKDGKEVVKTLCLTVWNRGVEALTLPNNNDDDNETLRALAMDAQRCLGGVELAFLSRDVNVDSVTNARVIFESLSNVDPYNASVRAGLGTSLLILGVMQEEESLLKLAMFHLKAAYSLCQKGAADVQLQSLFQSDASAMSAAILHNLALANISLGDDISSVSLLLRAAAMRRERSGQSAHLFWNSPDEVLLTIEQQAVLLGARRTRSQKKKKSKIPFLSNRFVVDETSA